MYLWNKRPVSLDIVDYTDYTDYFTYFDSLCFFCVDPLPLIDIVLASHSNFVGDCLLCFLRDVICSGEYYTYILYTKIEYILSNFALISIIYSVNYVFLFLIFGSLTYNYNYYRLFLSSYICFSI